MSTEKARELHMLLFPEEYDFHYDSTADARDRRRGINPMSAEYIANRDQLRSELGFGPYGLNSDAIDTLEWVEAKVQSDCEDELREILRAREAKKG